MSGATEAFDERFMRRAIELAERALGETNPNPAVGCVLAKGGKVVGEGFHARAGGPHAEAAALALAGGKARGATAYVTLEPCLMCAGAMMHARIARVVFGARDPKTGVAGSVLDLFAEARLNHHAEIAGGVCAEECGQLLSSFFAARRNRTELA